MQDIYTVSYDLTWFEYFNLSIYTLAHAKAIRRIVIFVLVLSLLSTLLPILLGSLAPGHSQAAGLQDYLTVILAPLSVCALFVAFALLVTAFISTFKPEIIRGHSYRFSPAGMEWITPSKQVMIPWSDFREIRESRSFFWLYVQQNNVQQVHAVQKRMFADEDSVRAFKVYVESHLNLGI
jgi:YcxB-like protein